MFKAFVENSFTNTPGSQWVMRGLYRLWNEKNGVHLIEEDWLRMISPGTSIIMSMELDDGRAPTTVGHSCPSPGCSGKLELKRGHMWSRWYVNRTLDITVLLTKHSSKCDAEVAEIGVQSPTARRRQNTFTALRANPSSSQPSTGSVDFEEARRSHNESLDPRDIIHFKRMTRL